MVDQTSTATRRAVLGAAIALPTIAVVPALAAKGTGSARSLFYARLDAFNRANAHFLRTCDDPTFLDEEGSDACHAAGRAYDLLVATPAPDFRAMTKKLAVLLTWSRGCTIEEDEVRLVYADAHRILAGEAVA